MISFCVCCFRESVWLELSQLTSEEAHRLTDVLARRCSGEPLAYITGKKEFWSLDFHVTPSTLIPRSDSEVLIETLVEQYPKQAKLKILDIGTGSGCLLLSALSEFPFASGVGIDISTDALQVALQNARAHNLSDRVELLQFDLKELPNLATAARASSKTAFDLLYQQFDVIICNPPYIPRNELHLVAPDVLAHEPHLALFSDGPGAVSLSDQRKLIDNEKEDLEGLRMYRYLQQSVDHLFKPRESHNSQKSYRQTLVVEIGSEAQAQAVRELFATSSTLKFQKFLIDGQQRHRGVLFQTSEK